MNMVPGFAFTHHYAYIGSITPMSLDMLIGEDNGGEIDIMLHDVYRSVLGAVVWTVLARLGVC